MNKRFGNPTEVKYRNRDARQLGGEYNIVFLSSARYSQPLDATTEKKFRLLKSLGRVFVVGFSKDLRPRSFTEHAHFYLLPQLSLPMLHYAAILMAAPLLACWLIFRHGVQVLVAQSPYEGFAAALGKKIAGWLGYRVVLVVESHGDFQKSLFLYRRIALEKLYRFVMCHIAKFALRHTDLLRAVSNSTKEQLKASGAGKPIFQFPAWTPIDIFLHTDTSVDRSSSQDILYAGVLIPLKGIHHLINAFVYLAKDFPQARLFLVGHEANKGYTAGLKEQVRRSGLDGQVHFLGAISQIELAAWMGKARLFVLPSASEGLPRVVLEAMASGTAVIASNVSGVPELVTDCATGFLVPPGDEVVLTEKMRWVLEHREEAEAMGRRARIFAERFFSTEIYVDGYRQVFDAARSMLAENEENAASTI